MAQYVKELAGKHDDLGSIPRAHIGKESPTSFPLTSTHVPCHVCTQTHACKINK